MTAKQKALELQEKYYGWDGPESAIDMALICVDEILSAINDGLSNAPNVGLEIKYWNDVKTELEKL